MSKIVVLFEVKPTKEGMDRYLELAEMLKPILANTDGLISAERFKSIINDGKLLSMSIWENEESIRKWRNVTEHRMSQMEGKTKLFEEYKISVASLVREYTNTERDFAPNDSNKYFYK